MRGAAGVALVVLLSAAGPAACAQDLPDHAAFTAVLQRVVRGPLVHYAALAREPEGLDAYLAALAGTDSAALAAAPRAARLAFWINAYNACTVKLVIEHYPIRPAAFPRALVRALQGVPANSIRQIPETFTRAFCDVAGAPRSLDGIEHEIIRPMDEPRIHFAVNCAARSCPVLAPEAYEAARLDAQLDAAVRRFVENPEHYQLERRANGAVLRLNKVLDWYQQDFGDEAGVVAFLLPYLPPEDAAYIRDHGPVRVEYAAYDWTLNDTAVFGAER